MSASGGGHQLRSRRDSAASSGGSPFRHRRSSLSIGSPASPSLPLAAAASINASMRGGSPGPATTARDDAASRRSSVVAELALADDKLPPPAEIAAADRKPSLADNLGASSSSSRTPSLNARLSSGGGGAIASSLGGSPTDSFRASAGLRDPLSNTPGEAGQQHQHRRAPSISQVHQEMEQEQEAQVNRLLITIHQQQQQIETLQRQLEATSGGSGGDGASSADAQPAMPILTSHLVERVPSSSSSTMGMAMTGGANQFPPPTPQRAHSTSSVGTTVASNMPTTEPSPALTSAMAFSRPSAAYMGFPHRPSSSSRGSSRAASPATGLARKASADGDDGRYWQSEAGNLGKENELLKQKIRELEKQLREGKDDTTAMAVD